MRDILVVSIPENCGPAVEWDLGTDVDVGADLHTSREPLSTSDANGEGEFGRFRAYMLDVLALNEARTLCGLTTASDAAFVSSLATRTPCANDSLATTVFKGLAETTSRPTGGRWFFEWSQGTEAMDSYCRVVETLDWQLEPAADPARMAESFGILSESPAFRAFHGLQSNDTNEPETAPEQR